MRIILCLKLGCGKTTFLDLLTGRRTTGNIEVLLLKCNHCNVLETTVPNLITIIVNTLLAT